MTYTVKNCIRLFDLKSKFQPRTLVKLSFGIYSVIKKSIFNRIFN